VLLSMLYLWRKKWITMEPWKHWRKSKLEWYERNYCHWREEHGCESMVVDGIHAPMHAWSFVSIVDHA
jgi:hypothetical protein